jgi:hypothetical protein
MATLGLPETIKARAGSRYGHALWSCRCDCGTVVEVTSPHLRYRQMQSCGCLRREGSHRTHEGSRSPEYRAWTGMKFRCGNPRSPDWVHYGGRNIRVCGRWLRSFQNFLDDMGRKPSPRHSLDRINTNGNYEPKNCRWATARDWPKDRRRAPQPALKRLREEAQRRAAECWGLCRDLDNAIARRDGEFIPRRGFMEIRVREPGGVPRAARNQFGRPRRNT